MTNKGHGGLYANHYFALREGKSNDDIHGCFPFTPFEGQGWRRKTNNSKNILTIVLNSSKESK